MNQWILNHLTLETFSTKIKSHNMKQIIINLLNQRNLEIKKYNLDVLYQAGINNILLNIEYYYDKPYTCQSVLKELFERGVIEKIKETQR
jgi:hypothetical protein